MSCVMRKLLHGYVNNMQISLRISIKQTMVEITFKSCEYINEKGVKFKRRCVNVRPLHVAL